MSRPGAQTGGAETGGAETGLAETVITALRARGETVAVAESLTAGLVAAALASVPGASAALRGGVVAYATDLKATLLGVSDALLRSRGAVAAETAEQMAVGVAGRCRADWGLATTGVAGPDPQEGHAPGTVFVAVYGPSGTQSVRLALHGDRQTIRHATADAVLTLLGDRLADRGPYAESPA